jgi:hypothetical protein
MGKYRVREVHYDDEHAGICSSWLGRLRCRVSRQDRVDEFVGGGIPGENKRQVREDEATLSRPHRSGLDGASKQE